MLICTNLIRSPFIILLCGKSISHSKQLVYKLWEHGLFVKDVPFPQLLYNIKVR